MYVPEAFALKERAAVHRVLRELNFAVLVSSGDGGLTATHLPFLLDPETGAKGTLLGHMARANPQWRDLGHCRADGRDVLVVFAGPHGYVSPNWYGDDPAVPTWNYQAVHVYGDRTVCSREVSNSMVLKLTSSVILQPLQAMPRPGSRDSVVESIPVRIKNILVSISIQIR